MKTIVTFLKHPSTGREICVTQIIANSRYSIDVLLQVLHRIHPDKIKDLHIAWDDYIG